MSSEPVVPAPLDLDTVAAAALELSAGRELGVVASRFLEVVRGWACPSAVLAAVRAPESEAGWRLLPALVSGALPLGAERWVARIVEESPQCLERPTVIEPKEELPGVRVRDNWVVPWACEADAGVLLLRGVPRPQASNLGQALALLAAPLWPRLLGSPVERIEALLYELRGASARLEAEAARQIERVQAAQAVAGAPQAAEPAAESRAQAEAREQAAETRVQAAEDRLRAAEQALAETRDDLARTSEALRSARAAGEERDEGRGAALAAAEARLVAAEEALVTERARAQQERAASEQALARVEQERAAEAEARSAAEQARAAAEQMRGAAVQALSAAEQARSLDAEARSGAEQSRASAEQRLAQLERERDAAEQARAAAEQGRQAAEQERGAVEQARATAERARLVVIDELDALRAQLAGALGARGELEQRLLGLEQALGEARTARSAIEGALGSARSELDTTRGELAIAQKELGSAHSEVRRWERQASDAAAAAAPVAEAARAALATVRRSAFVPPGVRFAMDEVAALLVSDEQGPAPRLRMAVLDRELGGLGTLAAELEAAGVDAKIANYPEELGLLLKTPGARDLALVVCDVMTFRPDQNISALMHAWRRDRPGLVFLLSSTADSSVELERVRRVPSALVAGQLPRPLTAAQLLEAAETAARRQAKV